MEKMKKVTLTEPVVCITGVTGFIGSHLLPLLKQQGVTLRVLKRSGEPGIEDGVETCIGDLFDQRSLVSFLNGAQVLINLAQPSGSLDDERFAEGMVNLARAAQQSGIRRLLHISTAMVVGVPDGECVNESSPCRPVTAYERQKLDAERILLRELTEGVDLGILRPTAVFGPGGKNLIKLAGIIADANVFYRSLLRFFHGRRHMHLVSVRDVVAAIVFLTLHQRPLSGNVFLISADDELENNYQAVDAIVGAAMGKPIPKFSPRLPAFVLRVLLRLAGRSQTNPELTYDSSKLQSWGFRRVTDFESELRQFAQAYLVQGRSS